MKLRNRWRAWRAIDEDPRATGSGPILACVVIGILSVLASLVFGKQAIAPTLGVAAVVLVGAAMWHSLRKRRSK